MTRISEDEWICDTCGEKLKGYDAVVEHTRGFGDCDLRDRLNPTKGTTRGGGAYFAAQIAIILLAAMPFYIAYKMIRGTGARGEEGGAE